MAKASKVKWSNVYIYTLLSTDCINLQEREVFYSTNHPYNYQNGEEKCWMFVAEPNMVRDLYSIFTSFQVFFQQFPFFLQEIKKEWELFSWPCSCYSEVLATEFLEMMKVVISVSWTICGWLSCYVVRLVVSSLRAVVLPVLRLWMSRSSI